MLWDKKCEGLLRAQVDELSLNPADDPCDIPPGSGYRGTENQLIRVEIHGDGEAGDATFKFSYDNAAYVYAIEAINGKVVTLKDIPSDYTRGLKEKGWVEVIDDAAEISRGRGTLAQVVGIDHITREITLDALSEDLDVYSPFRRPVLRRWDHAADADDGGIVLEEDTPYDLGSGVQITFQAVAGCETSYRSGAYWQIPVRVRTGDVEWATDAKGEKLFLPPQGGHHYAPLAIVTFNNGEWDVHDLRYTFSPIALPFANS